LADARRHLETVRTNLPARDTPSARAYLLIMRAHYLISARKWDDPARSWEIDRNGLTSIALAIDAFALGYAATKRLDLAEARQRLAELNTTAGMARGHIPTILAKELQAAILIGEGKVWQAVALLREATALEDSLPVEYGPPDVVKPTHELLGEALLQLSRPADAQREFARALELAPKRALSLLWLLRAATAAGDTATAQQARADLQGIWHAADADLLRLEELAVQR
jgi:predicted Zn-dependent protease